MKINKIYCPICGKEVLNPDIEDKDIKGTDGDLMVTIVRIKCCNLSFTIRIYGNNKNDGGYNKNNNGGNCA